MADYIPIIASETDPEAPLRSSLFKRLEANPRAIAEGAPGAPRVMPQAMKMQIARVTLSGTTPVTVTGLDPANLVGMFLFLSRGGAPGGVNLNARFSDDGGSTFGSWQVVLPVISPENNASLDLGPINLTTGERYDQSLGGVPVAMTVRTPVNAIGLSLSAAAASATVILYARGLES